MAEDYDLRVDDDVERGLADLLADIAREPVPAPVTELAQKLQQTLDRRKSQAERGE